MNYKLLEHDGFKYVDPEECLHPKGTKIIKIIKNTGEYTIAKINYKGMSEEGRYAIRWNLTDAFKRKLFNGEYCLGLPSIGRTPVWFVLPDDLFDDEEQFKGK